jgi:hypothetical protein
MEVVVVVVEEEVQQKQEVKQLSIDVPKECVEDWAWLRVFLEYTQFFVYLQTKSSFFWQLQIWVASTKTGGCRCFFFFFLFA